MPEITDAQYREYQAYTALGTPEDLKSRTGEVERLKEEAGTRRKENRALKEENDALKAKVPENAVVLEGDEATAYTALKTAGVTLKQASDGLTERDTLKAEKAARQREDAIRDGAKAEGWADPDAAARILNRDVEFVVLEVESRDTDFDVQRNGRTEKEKRKALFLKKDGKEFRLGDWVKEERKEILPALTANGSTGSIGLPAPEQRGAGATGGGGKNKFLEAAKKRFDEAAEKPNALRPAAKA